MQQLLTNSRLSRENLFFMGTGGVSLGNRCVGFLPAFFDTETGVSDLARFMDGRPAPCHLLDGVRREWVAKRDAEGRVMALKPSIVSGFLRNGSFYTRQQAAEVTKR